MMKIASLSVLLVLSGAVSASAQVGTGGTSIGAENTGQPPGTGAAGTTGGGAGLSGRSTSDPAPNASSTVTAPSTLGAISIEQCRNGWQPSLQISVEEFQNACQNR